MKVISNLNVLKQEFRSNENVWLLLYKKGSKQSDCAFESFKMSETKASNNVLCIADVNSVKDIHPEFNINSVPTLIGFEKGEIKNIIKGCHRAEQFNAIFEKSAFVANGSKEEKMAKNVTVYTTPTCSWCGVVKRHLQENGIQYKEVNVAAHESAAKEMVKKSGQQGVPQTEINGQVIVGFDKIRINTLLGIN